jgi:hypothetical protein
MFSPRDQPATRLPRRFAGGRQFASSFLGRRSALFMVQSGGTEHAIVQIVPAKPAIRLSQALLTHGGGVPSGLQTGGSVQSISIVLGSSERPTPHSFRKASLPVQYCKNSSALSPG